MKRGEKWNRLIAEDGVKNDPSKMADVNYYLENKPEEIIEEEETKSKRKK